MSEMTLILLLMVLIVTPSSLAFNIMLNPAFAQANTPSTDGDEEEETTEEEEEDTAADEEEDTAADDDTTLTEEPACPEGELYDPVERICVPEEELDEEGIGVLERRLGVPGQEGLVANVAENNPLDCAINPDDPTCAEVVDQLERQGSEMLSEAEVTDLLDEFEASLTTEGNETGDTSDFSLGHLAGYAACWWGSVLGGADVVDAGEDCRAKWK